MALEEELEGFEAEEGSQVLAVLVDVAAGFYAYGREFAFEDSAYAVYFARGEVSHEG